MYLCCISTSAYAGFFPESYLTIMKSHLAFPLNLFGGCFYFAIGKYLATNTVRLPNVLWKYSAPIFVIFELLSLAEYYLLYHFGILGESDVSFFVVPAVFFLCLSVIGSNKRVKNAKYLRKCSTIIYCSQGNVLLLSVAIHKVLGVHSLVSYAMCCVVELLIIVSLLYFQRKVQASIIHAAC